MRLVLTTALVFASAATAFASSITPVGGSHKGGSVTTLDCENCPARQSKARASAYKVPELAPGTQKVEIVDINGQKKLVRTEAWFGGSPVIYVSKVPAWMETEKAAAEMQPNASGSTERDIADTTAANDGVDIDATTSAVAAISQANVAAADSPAAPMPLALDTFQLRTN